MSSPKIRSQRAKKKPVGIHEALGVAVGCIGMSFDDFCKCAPVEFESICKAWQGMKDQQTRDAWERTRISAAIGIQPHVKKRITPQQLMPMPWDKKDPKRKAGAPRLTAEERKQRFEQLSGSLEAG